MCEPLETKGKTCFLRQGYRRWGQRETAVSCVPRWLQHRDFLIMEFYPDQFHLLENPLCSGKGEEVRR
jgi:hypothetical protein